MLNIGDKVVIKTWDELLEMEGAEELEDRNWGEYIYFDNLLISFVKEMKKYCGKEVTVSFIYPDNSLLIVEDGESFIYDESWFKKVES